MSPPGVVIEPRPGTLGRLPKRETRDWAAVVARHKRDDWPPPAWLAVMAGGGDDPYEAPGIPAPAGGRVAA